MGNTKKSASTEIAVKSTGIQQYSYAESNFGLQFSANIKVLKADIQAIYEVSNDKQSLLIAPIKADVPSRMSVKDFFDELHTSFGMTQEKVTEVKNSIKKVLGDQKATDLDNVSIQVNTLFLYMPSEDVTEYAFSVLIDLSDFGNLGPVHIKTIGFSIWNTTRQGVIKQMNLVPMAEKLKELD